MTFTATKSRVLNRGVPPDDFLTEMVAWARTADDEIFERNAARDIYTEVMPELGLYRSLTHRKAVMLEVMRVLAGFESSWNWNCGIDSTRKAEDTPENAEAGAWQVSYDSRYFDYELRLMLRNLGVIDGVRFQKITKTRHNFAMEYVARLMRCTTKHNGPLYRNRGVFPPGLRGPGHAIYPWLSRASVDEFEGMLK
jgi:hypothetical protein